MAAALAVFYLLPVLFGLGMPLEVRRLAALGHGAEALRTSRLLALYSLIPSIVVAIALNKTLFANFAHGAALAASLGVVLTPLTICWMCDVGALVGSVRFRAVLVLQVVQPATYVVVIVALWLSGRLDVQSALTGSIIAAGVALLVGLLLNSVPMQGSRYPLKGFMKGSVPYFGSTVAEAATYRLDQVLALPILGPYEAGIYSVAVVLGALPLALGHALAGPYFAAMARCEPKQRQGIRTQAVREGLCLGLASYLPMVLGSWVGIPFLFGRAFAPAVPVVAVYLVGSAAMVAAYVCSLALAAEGRGVAMTLAQCSSLIVGVVLLLLLGPIWGSMGAAAASSFALVVLLVALLHISNVHLRDVVPAPADFRMALTALLRSQPALSRCPTSEIPEAIES